MKIAIIGTKGIPNYYGGFEQFAQSLSALLTKKGHEVTVVTPRQHPIELGNYFGVKIKRISNPEKILGPVANIYYDTLSFGFVFRNKFDAVIECGYASSFFAKSILYNSHTKIITNMDGLEWKRKKWNFFTGKFIQLSELLSSLFSSNLVVDNHHLLEHYAKHKEKITCIPYGASLNIETDIKILEKYNLIPQEYFVTVARAEPENNLDLIISSYLNSQRKEPLVIACNITGYGKRLMKKYKENSKVRFILSEYNNIFVNTLRKYSKAYLHGHSAGGTNPSLLEAMAAETLIIASDNKFNRSVTNDSAYYFKDSETLCGQFKNIEALMDNKAKFNQSNLIRIKEKYRWELIADQYERLFES